MLQNPLQRLRAWFRSPAPLSADDAMRQVSKPQGYELRTRRADKEASCEKWEPCDALYESQQLMRGKDVRACVVIWQEADTKGNVRVCARRAGHADTTARITMQKAGHYMGWGD